MNLAVFLRVHKKERHQFWKNTSTEILEKDPRLVWKRRREVTLLSLLSPETLKQEENIRFTDREKIGGCTNCEGQQFFFFRTFSFHFWCPFFGSYFCRHILCSSPLLSRQQRPQSLELLRDRETPSCEDSQERSPKSRSLLSIFSILVHLCILLLLLLLFFFIPLFFISNFKAQIKQIYNNLEQICCPPLSLSVHF